MYPRNEIRRVRGVRGPPSPVTHPIREMLRSVLAIPASVRCTPCRYGNDLLSLDGRASDGHSRARGRTHARARVKHSNKDIRPRTLFELPPLPSPVSSG